MRISRSRQRWLAVGLALVLVVGAIRLLDQPLRLETYRVLDDQTLALVASGASYSWMHVTGVAETDQTVTISVNALTLQLGPSTVLAARRYIPVYLSEPLEGRTVIDGSTGEAIPVSQ